MNTKILQNLGQRLRTLRMERELTQEQLAALVRIHPTYVGKLEAGKCNLSIKMLFRISRALKVTLYDIFEFDK